MGASFSRVFCCFGESTGEPVRFRRFLSLFFGSRRSSLQGFPQREQQQQQQQQEQQRQRQRQRTEETVCGLCHACVDPVLLEGHREVCRAKHMGRVQRNTARLAGVASEADNDDDEGLCVVCCAEKVKYAFLPCGHLACCGTCGAILDKCPVCRGPREALCIVSNETFLQFKCPYCGLIISPVLYDGHREVCAVLHSGRTGVAENAGGDSPAADAAKADNILSGVISTCCLECQSTEVPLVIARPCGHRAICAKCAFGRTTCPVCLQDVQDVCKSYV